MINFDRLTFLRLVGEYGHAEFMLGMEGMGNLRDHKAEVAREACDKLTNYVGDALAGRDPAALDETIAAFRVLLQQASELFQHIDENYEDGDMLGNFNPDSFAIAQKRATAALAAFEKGEG